MERTGSDGKELRAVAGTEGGRRPTGVPATPAASRSPGAGLPVPDAEVLENVGSAVRLGDSQRGQQHSQVKELAGRRCHNKYRPEFPNRFGSQEHARSFCTPFFHWYNHEHYHSGIGLLTPAMVHYGLADAVIAARQGVLDAAYAAHPERFVNQPPSSPLPPTEVCINPPQQTQHQTTNREDCHGEMLRPV